VFPSVERFVAKLVDELRQQLGSNLSSCCLYGSAVRGNFVEGQSDINLLIVLGRSDPAAHAAVARAIGNEAMVDPFIVDRHGFARTARVFAAKFASIKANYQVISGSDPLAGLEIDPAQERFLCEQALRNLQLRLTYAFVTRERTRAYRRFLVRSVTPLFIRFSEVLRLEGASVPVDFEARIPLFEEKFKTPGAVMRDLLTLKVAPDSAPKKGDEWWHERVFPVVSTVVSWVQDHWRDG
jgi:predicted nucleotidyltransferase